MKYVIVALLALVSVFAVAQNAPLPTQTVTTTFQEMALPSYGNTLAATVVDAGVSFSPSTTLSFETLQTPSAPAGFGGFYGVAFGYQFNQLSTLLNNATTGSGFRFRFTVIGSAGGVKSASGDHVAGTARFRTEYALSSGGMWNVAAEVGATRLIGVTKGWAPIVSVGLPIHF